MSNLQWPPRDRAEMQTWQDKHGNDWDISGVVGVRPHDVRYRRLVFDVPALPQIAPDGKIVENQFREKAPKQLVTDAAMADIYDDRTYDDAGVVKW